MYVIWTEWIVSNRGFGFGETIHSIIWKGTPVLSGACAFGFVRRESVWQRAGPDGGIDPIVQPSLRFWFAKDGMDVGLPW